MTTRMMRTCLACLGLVAALSGCSNQVYFGHLNNHALIHSIPLRRVVAEAPFQAVDVVVVKGRFPRSEPALSTTGYFSDAWQADFRDTIAPALVRHGIEGRVVFVQDASEVEAVARAPYVLLFQPQALTLMPHGGWYFIHHEVFLRPATSTNAIYRGYVRLYPYLQGERAPTELWRREGELRPVFEDLTRLGLILPVMPTAASARPQP